MTIIHDNDGLSIAFSLTKREAVISACANGIQQVIQQVVFSRKQGFSDLAIDGG